MNAMMIVNITISPAMLSDMMIIVKSLLDLLEFCPSSTPLSSIHINISHINSSTN